MRFGASALITISLACAAASLYGGRDAWARAHAEAEALARAQSVAQQVAVIERAVTGVTARGDDAFANRSVDDGFSQSVAALLLWRSRYSITIHQVVTDKNARSADNMMSVQDIATPVPWSAEQVREVSFRVKGNYADLSAFKQFLAALRTLPVAVLELSVSGNTFELRLSAFGTATAHPAS